LVQSTAAQLRQLGAFVPSLAFDECEIGVLYPSRLVPDLDAFQGELQKLDRALRTIIEIVGENGSPKIHGLSTGTLEIFVVASVAVGRAISKIVNMVLEAAERVPSFPKKRFKP
jgi:hypothetical protein